MTWQTLGGVDPKELTTPRLHAHWAAQVIAAVGETLLDHESDTSHTAFTWSPEEALLAGRSLPGADGIRVGLHFDPFELAVVERGGQVAATFGLAGRSLADALGWTRAALAPRIQPAPERLVRPEYELPAHALAEHAAFGSFPDAYAELGRWFANAHRTLAELRTTLPDTSEVVCWPHHFDIAVLSSLARDASGQATRTLGVGFSPGDEDHLEPYWYVNHWPVVFDAELKPLPAGEWHTQGWVGTVLPAREIVSQGGAQAQREQTLGFLRVASDANQQLLNSPGAS